MQSRQWLVVLAAVFEQASAARTGIELIMRESNLLLHTNILHSCGRYVTQGAGKVQN